MISMGFDYIIKFSTLFLPRCSFEFAYVFFVSGISMEGFICKGILDQLSYSAYNLYWSIALISQGWWKLMSRTFGMSLFYKFIY